MENQEENKDWKKCTPDCTCEGPGYCPVYNINMTPKLHNLCKNDIEWRWNFQNFFAPAKTEAEVKSRQYQQRAYLEKHKMRREKEKLHREKILLDQAIKEVEDAGVNLKNYEEKSAGLGDLIGGIFSKLGITEEVTEKWSGIKGCGCGKRKKFLNKIFPFRKKE